jgi:phage gp29-like protein
MAKQTKNAPELKERPDKLLSKIVPAQAARARRDIQTWMQAIRAAENVERPKRTQLYSIYRDVLLDADLTAEIQRRQLALVSSGYNLYDETGSPVPEATAMLNGKWFAKLLMYAFESILWGHSLVEITELTPEGKVGTVELVNRFHVIPERGIVVQKPTDDTGTVYRGEPSYDRFLFEFGETHSLGLLMQTVPHVLYQRFAQGAWSEFCEIFGIPPRYAKTNSRDTNSLNRLEQMLIQMGTASYAVIDKEEEVEFLEVANTNGDVFERLMKVAASKIAKLINGAVIGEDSQGGSRAKEQVGADIAQNIYNGDKKWFEGYMNEQVIPKLIALGYPFEGLSFEFTREKNLQEEWRIVSGVLNHFTVDPKYIEQTFGVPVIEQKMDGRTPAEPNNASASTDFFH